jgi:hypothetical protein
MGDPRREEEARILRLVREEMAKSGVSIRELERRRSGEYRGLLQRIFSGDGRLTYCTLLEMLDHLGIKWDGFFHAAYGSGRPSSDSDYDSKPLVVTQREIDELVNQKVRAALDLVLKQQSEKG